MKKTNRNTKSLQIPRGSKMHLAHRGQGGFILSDTRKLYSAPNENQMFNYLKEKGII